MKKLTFTMENYLEAIYRLSLDGKAPGSPISPKVSV
jgi:hypothetical protein